MKEKIKFIILIIAAFALDRITKIIVIKNIEYLSRIDIIDHFLSLTYVKNTGAAWSILENKQLLLIIISIVFLGIILYIALKEKMTKINILQYSLIIGGGLGNLYDRIFLKYVVDFISIEIFNYNSPIFNVADMCICIGVILLIITMLRSEKNEGNNNH